MTMINMVEEITLSVAESFAKNALQDIIRFDDEFMQKINVSVGDVIEIEGERITYAVAHSAAKMDVGKNIARIGIQVRSNAGVEINDYITIKKVIPKDAKMVELMLNTPDEIINRRRFKRLIRSEFTGKLVHFMQIRSFLDEECDFFFTVSATNPSGPLIVTNNTNIIVSDEDLIPLMRNI